MVTFKTDDDETHDEASTNHNRGEGSILDETGTTRHEPLLLVEEEKFDEYDAYMEKAAKAKEEEDARRDAMSLKLNRKIAEIAAKAYRRASEQSNVLSRAKLADVALMRFDELEVGKFLGKGSFSNVHEITKISCCGDDDDNNDDNDDEGSWDGMADNDDKKGEAKRATLQAGNEMFVAGKKKSGNVVTDDPRKLLAMNHRHAESNTFRYAIKFLKQEIRSVPQKYAVGTSDLVVEGMFLASLSHPNIIKVRGLPEGGVKSLVKKTNGSFVNDGPNLGYFLILDRLFDTLSDRIYGEWKMKHRLSVKKKFGFVASKDESAERNKDLAVRVKVAFDVSAALKFLHSKSIIYRDLKPENLGFDVRGDIKLFDLGLVKELHPNMEDKRGNYRLSMAGTPRYMAPECGLYQPYNLKADVYSLSMLLWEILTLQKPLKDFTYSRLKNGVFIDGERPPIKKVFNKKLRALVSSGWHQNPKNRPSMDKMYDELKAEYLTLAPDSKMSEVTHNRRRSTYVSHQLQAMSVRHLLRLDSVLNDVKE